MSDYIHGFTRAEQDRLLAQAELWKDRLILPELPFREGERVLEIGCGVGAVLATLGKAFPRVEWAGVDLVAAQLERAEAVLAAAGVTAELHQSDASALPFEDASVDHVYMMWFLEHVLDPLPFLRESLRVLRPGGTIHINETDYSTFLVWPLSADADHLAEGQRRLFRDRGNPVVGRSLGALLTKAGFEGVRNRPMGFHYFTGQPELASTTEYMLGFLEPMIPQMVAAGFDEGRLRAGADHVRGLATRDAASFTQIVFRGSGAKPAIRRAE